MIELKMPIRSFGTMKILKSINFLILLIIALLVLSAEAQSNIHVVTCTRRSSPCFLRRMPCPKECASINSTNSQGKVCFIDCESSQCATQCKRRKPNCNLPGSICYDPRFIGGDGVLFYFHGKSNEHFSLVSDPNFQINARFIGHRPKGRTRDFTWIQAIGILFHSHTFILEATKAATWDDRTDHLKFYYDTKVLLVPEGYLSSWESREGDVRVERTSTRNSALLSIGGLVDITVNVVPITKEDDRLHNYRLPSNNCFPHLEVQFKFYSLSAKVEGVLGRTYQEGFKNPANIRVPMPVVGGEDKYRTTNLLSADCALCIFNAGTQDHTDFLEMDAGTLDCTSDVTRGHGILCRR